MPLFKESTYQNLLETHLREGNDCTVLTGTTHLKLAYGRVVRDAEGKFDRVVEDKDCTPEQKQIKELNVGVYVFDNQKMLSVLGETEKQQQPGRVLPNRCSQADDGQGLEDRHCLYQ